MNEYQVIVGNVGTVYDGKNKRDAMRTYKAYVIRAILPNGRAAGASVYLMANGEIMKEFFRGEREVL